MSDRPSPSPLAREAAALFAAADLLVSELLTLPLAAGQVHPLSTPAGKRLGAQVRAFRAFTVSAPELAALARQFKAGNDWREQLDAAELGRQGAELLAGRQAPPAGLLDAPALPPIDAKDDAGQLSMFGPDETWRDVLNRTPAKGGRR